MGFSTTTASGSRGEHSLFSTTTTMTTTGRGHGHDDGGDPKTRRRNRNHRGGDLEESSDVDLPWFDVGRKLVCNYSIRRMSIVPWLLLPKPKNASWKRVEN